MKVLIVFAVLLAGCGGDRVSKTRSRPTPPPPPAKPQLVKSKVLGSIFSDNVCVATVKNLGKDGRVYVRVTWEKSRTSSKRGESGAGKAWRETFTRDDQPGRDYTTTWYEAGKWDKELYLQSGEEKTVRFDLPGHSTLSGRTRVTAVARYGNGKSGGG